MIYRKNIEASQNVVYDNLCLEALLIQSEYDFNSILEQTGLNESQIQLLSEGKFKDFLYKVKNFIKMIFKKISDFLKSLSGKVKNNTYAYNKYINANAKKIDDTINAIKNGSLNQKDGSDNAFYIYEHFTPYRIIEIPFGEQYFNVFGIFKYEVEPDNVDDTINKLKNNYINKILESAMEYGDNSSERAEDIIHSAGTSIEDFNFSKCAAYMSNKFRGEKKPITSENISRISYNINVIASKDGSDIFKQNQNRAKRFYDNSMKVLDEIEKIFLREKRIHLQCKNLLHM